MPGILRSLNLSFLQIDDPDPTQRHRGDWPTDPQITRRSAPHPHSPEPVSPPTPHPRRRARRRRPGPLGCALRAGLAAALFAALFSCLLAVLYVLAPPPRLTVLILGVDSREGEGMIARTDTIILATVDPRQPYVGLMSIPRDLYVDVPGYGMNRINSANVFGENTLPGSGPGLAAQTIETSFGVAVHRTVRVDFEGFVAIVDAAGGVTIDVQNAMIDTEYPTSDFQTMVVEFQPGRQHMDGARALQYARIRHGSSDFSRIGRQQEVLLALVRQLAWPGNWFRLPAVYQAFTEHVETNVTMFDVLAMAPAVLWVGSEGVDNRTITTEMVFHTATSNGAAILEPDWTRIDPVLQEMFLR